MSGPVQVTNGSELGTALVGAFATEHEKAVKAYWEKAVSENSKDRATNFLIANLVPSLLTAVGLAKQYDLAEKQGELAAQQAASVEELKKLQLDQYNNIAKPTWQFASDKHRGYFWTWGKGLIESVAKCGASVCEFKPDANSANRAIAQIASAMNVVKLRSKRSLGKYSTGKCCDNDYRLAALEMQMRVDAVNMAERYNDTRKLQWDQFYWQRQSGVAQIAQNIGSMTANLMVNQASQLSGVLNGLTNLVNTSQSNLTARFAALENQSNLFGSLGTLGGELSGRDAGRQLGANMLGNLLPRTFGQQSNGALYNNTLSNGEVSGSLGF